MRHMIASLAVLFTTTVALAEDKTISVPTTGDAAVTFTVPSTAKVTVDGGKTTIDMNKLNLYVWLAPKAKTIDDAAADVSEIVKSESVNLKIQETKTIQVAGADAKQIIAKSNEADDNDPGTTDVVIFTVGGKVVVASIHGENEFAPKHRQAMLDILATAKAP